jgi:manganese/zinc/iron transport system permease protein
MIGLASAFGAASGLFGAYVSFLAPRLPTGPWMVVVVSAVFAVSILFAPKRGVVARVRRHRSHRRKIIRENILKALFKPGFENRDWSRYCSVSNLEDVWSFTRSELTSGLSTLKRRGLIEEHNEVYRLTSGGVAEGARVTRLHRLWELYLTQYLDLAGDHVHRDAEDIEHIITPEMEKQLEAALDKPRFDPHNQEIPYIDREETV